MSPALPSIALYGGSFNPPHAGHVMVATWVLTATDVDQFWVVPTWSHAFAKSLASYDDRTEMCRAAFDVLDPTRVRISDVERQLGGESRTIDTVEHIRATTGITDITLVVGTDIFTERHLWKRWEDLERLCRFVVVGRDGYPDPDGVLVSPPLLDVSSTTIRERVALGDYPATLPRRVADVVRARGLYV